METLKIFKGKEAEEVCQYILDYYDYEAQKYYEYYGACGYWYDYDIERWIAFDNRTGDCYIEQFIGESSARRFASSH